MSSHTMMAMLEPGIELLLIGLGSVFAFLILLIATIKGVSAGARVLDSRDTVSAAADAPIPAHHTAVIAAAIQRFRQ